MLARSKPYLGIRWPSEFDPASAIQTILVDLQVFLNLGDVRGNWSKNPTFLLTWPLIFLKAIAGKFPKFI